MQQPKGTQIKFQSLPLSKKNLVLLFQNKKSKFAKNYIEQLRNKNAKAQKIIKQVLDEIFCQQKVTTPTAYLYAMIFYKNLLVSAELDYYEDNDFFPIEIHNAVALICEFNAKETNFKVRGSNYFKQKVLIQQNQSNNQNLQTMGIAVVTYALEILQTMAQVYKKDYFSGGQQDSHFTTKYNAYIKKGITFPKKQEYAYIKQNDIKEFQENFRIFTQMQDVQEQEQAKVKVQPKKQQKTTVQNTKKQQQTKTRYIDPSKLGYQATSLQDKKIADSPKKQQQPTVPKPLNNISSLGYQNMTPSPQKKQISSSKVEQKNIQKQKPSPRLSQPASNIVNQIGNSKVKSKEQSKILIEVSKQSKAQSINKNVSKQSKPQNQLNNTSGSKQLLALTKPVLQSKIQNKKSTPKKQDLINSVQKTSLKEQIHKKIQIKQQQKPNIPALQLIKQKINNNKITQPIAQNLIQKYPLALGNQRQINQKQKQLTGQKINQQQNKNIQKSLAKRQGHVRLKIFQQRPKLNNQLSVTKLSPQTNQISPINNNSLNKLKLQKSEKSLNKNQKSKVLVQQTNQKNNQSKTPHNGKTHILYGNISFSPEISQKMGFHNNRIVQRKSVPKTQKKFIQNTFLQGQQLAMKFGLKQNIFTNTKKSTQKLPVKTLSSWRYQRQYKKDFSPEQKAKKDVLTYMIKKLRFPQLTIPFIPQYFTPVTIKMSGLRRSALDVSNYSQSSQVFFNNNIVQARLMKPSKNLYVLSLLNISKHSLKISPSIMSGIQYACDISIIGNTFSIKQKVKLNVGCYFDIKFTFKASDLNFKFLPFRLEIDQKILNLQLPITLLDQCVIYREISIDDISVIQKKKGRLIKSSPFKTNINDLPQFMKFSEIKNISSRNNPTQPSNTNDFIVSHFTLKIKIQENEEQNILSCFISHSNPSLNVYQMNIIFDSSNNENQNVAKVLVEILVFLLAE